MTSFTPLRLFLTNLAGTPVRIKRRLRTVPLGTHPTINRKLPCLLPLQTFPPFVRLFPHHTPRRKSTDHHLTWSPHYICPSLVGAGRSGGTETLRGSLRVFIRNWVAVGLSSSPRLRDTARQQGVRSGPPAARGRGWASELWGGGQRHQSHPSLRGVLYSLCAFGYEVAALTKTYGKGKGGDPRECLCH